MMISKSFILFYVMCFSISQWFSTLSHYPRTGDRVGKYLVTLKDITSIYLVKHIIKD